MDGNGRWAKQRGLERIAGHQEGRKTAKKIIEACAKKSIPVLTLFAFGRENWERPEEEVNFLMELFLQSLKQETNSLQKNNVCLQFIGDLSVFNHSLQQQIKLSEQQTATNGGLKLIIAANYSGQWDILQATKKILEQIKPKICFLECYYNPISMGYIKITGSGKTLLKRRNKKFPLSLKY